MIIGDLVGLSIVVGTVSTDGFAVHDDRLLRKTFLESWLVESWAGVVGSEIAFVVLYGGVRVFEARGKATSMNAVCPGAFTCSGERQ